ncbi:hypothetical protein J8273_6970 [Carpediemonas membranifera]|uniref:Uncharacterized protein n=1 Tax=Carpediemonas membranifera TaxID=201153 RepID=A0A8J6AT03_9EUKA|nr:hypothetical protein J8273_6970 [Carpediemonas membranifera]|eukprot:KAG9390720.1 hypothetical protein J8273_6970 [Carpediemonas membranifera]
MSPELRLLKQRAHLRRYFSLPNQQKGDRTRLVALAFQTSMTSDYLISSPTSRSKDVGRSRDPTLSDAEQLRSFLRTEGQTSGPDSVGRKAYWIVKAAPRWSSFTVPRDYKAIQREAVKRASLAGLTGGARPIYRTAMLSAIRKRNRCPKTYQAVLFASLCFLTVSRGREIFNLTPAQVKFDRRGDAILAIPRTKTMVAISKRVTNVWIHGFNPADALRRWVRGLALKPDARLWREVISSRAYSRKRERSATGLLRDVQQVFGRG